MQLNRISGAWLAWSIRLTVLLFALSLAEGSWAATLYTGVRLDEAAGTLTIKRSDGGSETPVKDRDRGEEMKRQTGFAQPRLSPDRETAGWLSLYPNCCTSYDIARELVLYRDSKVMLRLRGNGQTIFRWNFSKDGKSVAFCQGPLHFSDYRHYELHSIPDGKLIESTDTGENNPATPALPWAKGLGCP